MKRKLFVTALALVLLAGAVAVGVHVFNREARADVEYSIELWENVGGIPTPVTGANVEFWINVGGQDPWLEYQSIEMGGGVYSFWVEDNVAPVMIEWEVTIPVSFVPINPDESPTYVDDDVFFLSWEVNA